MITSKDILKIVESDDIKSQILDLKKELKRLTGSDIDVGLSGNNKVYLAKHGNSTSPLDVDKLCLLYTSPSPRDRTRSRMPSSA